MGRVVIIPLYKSQPLPCCCHSHGPGGFLWHSYRMGSIVLEILIFFFFKKNVLKGKTKSSGWDIVPVWEHGLLWCCRHHRHC